MGPFGGCGIAGALALGRGLAGRKLPPFDFEGMVEALAHRGPDGSGIVADDRLALGHRRLSILDPSDRGAQPMRRDGLTIVHCGEVYNFAEIRRELSGRGVSFTSGTDTEVILRAYQAWGPACLARFNGMFAFAIWDEGRSELFLARDRLGIKPLYYFRGRELFLFASEVRPLLLSGLVPLATDWETLFHQVLVTSFFQCDLGRTLVRDVRCLPPGHYLQVSADGETRLSPYWDLPAREHRDGSAEELAAELLALVDDSVRLRLVSDVPVASLLSGGLDSSMITALAAARNGGAPLRSITFEGGSEAATSREGARDPDRQFSRLLVGSLGGRLDPFAATVEQRQLDLETIAETTDLASLPDDERLPAVAANYVQVRRAGCKVVLNGQGADELMGGYVAYHPLLRVALAPPPDGDVVGQTWPFLRAPVPGLHPEAQRHQGAVYEALRRRFDAFSGSPLRRSHLLLTATQLHRILRFEDFLSMRVGVECRVPFLDHRLVEWAFSVPFERHLDSARTTGKALLRRAAADLLPAPILARAKHPFPRPDPRQLESVLLGLLGANREEIRRSETLGRLLDEPLSSLPGAGLSAADAGLILVVWGWERALLACRPGPGGASPARPHPREAQPAQLHGT